MRPIRETHRPLRTDRDPRSARARTPGTDSTRRAGTTGRPLALIIHTSACNASGPEVEEARLAPPDRRRTIPPPHDSLQRRCRCHRGAGEEPVYLGEAWAGG